MKTAIILACVLLTGCAGPMQFIANTYDRNDPCQTGEFDEAERKRLKRPVGYKAPNWCGASDPRPVQPIVVYKTVVIKESK